MLITKLLVLVITLGENVSGSRWSESGDQMSFNDCGTWNKANYWCTICRLIYSRLKTIIFITDTMSPTSLHASQFVAEEIPAAHIQRRRSSLIIFFISFYGTLPYKLFTISSNKNYCFGNIEKWEMWCVRRSFWLSSKKILFMHCFQQNSHSHHALSWHIDHTKSDTGHVTQSHKVRLVTKL